MNAENFGLTRRARRARSWRVTGSPRCADEIGTQKKGLTQKNRRHRSWRVIGSPRYADKYVEKTSRIVARAEQVQFWVFCEFRVKTKFLDSIDLRAKK